MCSLMTRESGRCNLKQRLRKDFFTVKLLFSKKQEAAAGRASINVKMSDV